jgi:hypothetical protein
MPVIIQRSFGVNYKSLLTRPRISYKVSEYVFEFINEQILKPNKVLQSDKYIYKLTLSFSFEIPKNRKFPFPYTSPFSAKTRLYFPQNGYRTFEKVEKWATLGVIADDIDETITPYEYAKVVFTMFAEFLLYNYKKLDKSIFDDLILKLDKNYIESFNFPASFDDQQYILDHTEYPIAPLEYGYEWADLDKLVTINPRIEYLKHYEF